MKCSGLSLRFLAATLFLTLAGPDALAAKKPKKDLPATSPPAEVDTTGIDPTKDISKRFDLDGDGLLDDKERAAAVAFMAKQPDAAAASTSAGGKDRKGKLADLDNLPERVVARFDTNQDGKLDDAERAEARKAIAERTGGKFREELVKRFDKNGNGKIDDDERAAAEAAVKKRKQGAMAAAITKPAPATDADVESTLRAAITADPTRLQRFDTDQNGKLSDAEWSAARAAIGKILAKP